jgi:undecaprenyl-diphosphatase
MNLFEAFILGILQGIMEWLPISSEGQTVLLMLQYLHMSLSDVISYAIFLHIGTMLAVLVRFRYDFLSMLSRWNSPLSQTVIIASTAITAIPLYFFLKTNFTSDTHYIHY